MIKELMIRKNLSVYRLAKTANIPYSTISDIISGKTALGSVSASTLAAVAGALDVSMDDLFYGRTAQKPVYLYNEGRIIHIEYEQFHFKFTGPKNLIALKNINRVAEGCAHVNAYFSDRKIVYLEEEYIDIKGEFDAYGCADSFPGLTDLRIGRPGDGITDRYKDEALMICDNMAVLNHISSTDDLEIEVINMSRQSSRMVMRLRDYAVLSSSMSDTMEHRTTSMIKRNNCLIKELVALDPGIHSDTTGGDYA